MLDGARPDVTAFLPMAMLIAGQEGKDVACHGPIDSSYLLNLNTSFAPFASAFFGGHSVEATARLANIAGVATKLEVPLLTLDTNFHQLFDEPHLRCHTIRNLCARFARGRDLWLFGLSDYQAVSFVDAFTHGISFIDQIVSASLTPR